MNRTFGIRILSIFKKQKSPLIEQAFCLMDLIYNTIPNFFAIAGGMAFLCSMMLVVL
jgi:hypothetical protein